MVIKDLGPTFNQIINRRVTFTVDNKIVRDGILIGFSAKSFNLKFDFENDKTELTKSIELPYPFNISKIKHSLVFDYKVSNLNNIIKAEELDKFIEENGKIVSKYYNSAVTITLRK